jgi:hypothetical protein
VIRAVPGIPAPGAERPDVLRAEREQAGELLRTGGELVRDREALAVVVQDIAVVCNGPDVAGRGRARGDDVVGDRRQADRMPA